MPVVLHGLATIDGSDVSVIAIAPPQSPTGIAKLLPGRPCEALQSQVLPV
jgi:hypothetical protein